MSNIKATVFDMQRGSFVDGAGIRTTVFFKGCNLRCKWCHNPEGLSSERQLLFYEDKCTQCQKCKSVCENPDKCILCGKCALYCPNDAREICGCEYTPEEIFSEVIKDKSFFDESGGGATFSGGECMLNVDFLLEILKLCKKNGIHTAIDTAGNISWASFEKILTYTDTFLYDIKCLDEKKHIRGTGVSNKLILENLERLSKTDKDIVIRIPIIPDFNDNFDEMTEISRFLKRLNIRSVELLPYHDMAEHKYRALGMEFTKYPPLPKEKLDMLRAIFKE